jgi:NitT/TauT family transport system ATP-binding protein
VTKNSRGVVDVAKSFAERTRRHARATRQIAIGDVMLSQGMEKLSEPATPFIDLKKISLVYGEEDQTVALDRLDLSIDRGSFVAIVGPSGCGKSTLLKLISGLSLPTTGNVTIEGNRVDAPIDKVGMAFQNPLLMPWRTTLQNVLLPLEIVARNPVRYRRDEAQHIDKARQLLTSVGLKDFEAKYPWQLSGGMQQRASLCRAIIHSPEILLLDEPFAALDSFTREELWQAMQDLWLRDRFTAMLVTHDLREAVYLADVIYIMSGRPGRIIERQIVDFPRSRPIEITSSPRFVEIVDHLRRIVAGARAQ